MGNMDIVAGGWDEGAEACQVIMQRSANMDGGELAADCWWRGRAIWSAAIARGGAFTVEELMTLRTMRAVLER